MPYLLDTNVVSELRKRDRCNPGVRRWYETVAAEELFLSVLAIGEIRRGIELLRRRDVVGAQLLTRWLQTLEQLYEDRMLPVTVDPHLALRQAQGRLSPAVMRERDRILLPYCGR
jgi:hypothetical protein